MWLGEQICVYALLGCICAVIIDVATPAFNNFVCCLGDQPRNSIRSLLQTLLYDDES